MHFGATLQLLRNHAGLSLRGLGLQVGVSAAYLSRVEHGRDAAPTAERVLAIAAALRLPGALLLEILELLGGDAGEWLRATPIGRRLAAELRLRSLSEAQLARVLAFVQREFPLGPEAERRTVRGFLCADSVLVRVRVHQIDDAWTLAALRLGAGREAETLLGSLRASAATNTTCLGDGVAVSFVGGAGPLRIALVVSELAMALVGPDAIPVQVVWVLIGLSPGLTGAAALTAVARLAEPGLVRELLRCTTPEAVLGVVERAEGIAPP